MTEKAIRLLEKLKGEEKIDQALAESAPLLSALEPDEIRHLDTKDIINKSKLEFNKRVAVALRRHGHLRDLRDES